MEDLVLTIEQCKHLQDLGLDMSDAKLCWIDQVQQTYEYGVMSSVWIIKPNDIDYSKIDLIREYIPTYTLQEIWNKLPEKLEHNALTYQKVIQLDSFIYEDTQYGCYMDVSGGTILQNAYTMLCWVIEHGYLKFK